MSILPTFWEETIENLTVVNDTLPTAREYGIDFETGKLTGSIVEGTEAIKVWIWNCLHTERFHNSIYSWQYGVEYEQYIGQTISDELLMSDAQIETEEALMINPYITGISDFSAKFSGSKLHISFTVETTLGNLEVNTDV